ncbi:putative MFS-type transporter [Tolypocladium ophioglossoides CBS 100239]|uniref:Putative MFS-type transporter n=1 Tax=Tolypocladium ophioglossoides (strain CBS 100239) TaxID=1163406 RepID=A0A0L0MWS8_TOLOC|nr:putative MFS-type transporter [Tolypocladium ophioglossoides CBS 100239]
MAHGAGATDDGRMQVAAPAAEAGAGAGATVMTGDKGASRTPTSDWKASNTPASDDAGSGSSKDGSGDQALPMSKARCIALVATVTGAAFLNTLSVQSVIIVLPTIGRELDVPESRQQWIVSSYSLTFGCLLLLWARVADIYGKRRIFILGSVWVTAVTAANPFMPNEIAFDLFRALHGLGAAANVPTAIGILGVTFPPGKAKNYAFSAYAAGAPLGSVSGNILSGLVAEYSSWKWVFGVSAIIAGIIAVAGIVFIPPAPPPPNSATALGESKPASKPAIDWIGATLITVGLVGLMFALTEGNVVGWRTPWVPVTIVASLLVVAAFVGWQRYLELAGGRPPLVKVSIFRNLRIGAVMVIMCLFFASFGNFLVFATYFFQGFQGLSPVRTMLRFVPTGISGAVIAVIIAQLLGRIPTVFILACGCLAVSLATLLFAVPIAPTTSYFAYGLPAMILSVIGADATWPCLTLFTSQALPREDQAIGGALINAVSQFGRASGLAVGTAIQTAVMADARGVNIKEAGGIEPWDPASLKGIRAANWLSFGFGVASLAIVLVAFHNMEIVGRTGHKSPPPREGGEEGILINEENPDVERKR